MTTIPYGRCHCGCGEMTPIAKKTDGRCGHVKGEPICYINGHYQRSSKLSQIDYIVDGSTGCWVWQRHLNPSGYGEMRDGRRMRVAHRVYFERLRSPIPAGLQLDHLCRNRACVNPDHLEPVTSRENTLRGDTVAARRKAQTQCVNGHPFDEDNTIHPGRWRACRECQRAAVRDSQRRYRAKLADDHRWRSNITQCREAAAVDYLVDENTGCWVWQRYLGLDGYALKRRNGRKIGAHRYYYELHRGPIPKGLMLDHLCRNRSCVNPHHLEPVTALENARRRLPREPSGGLA